MTTFNGTHENLKFSCNVCELSTDSDCSIEIDLDNKADKDKLWGWLQKHSSAGGKYTNVPVNINKIPFAKRTEAQHAELVKQTGGIKAYLIENDIIN